MSLALPRPSLRRPTGRSDRVRVLATSFFLMTATLMCAILRATTTTGVVAVGVILASMLWLNWQLRPVGYISLGGVTLWIILVLFLGKWILLGERFVPAVAGPTSKREAALSIVAVGALCFALGYRLIPRRPSSQIAAASPSLERRFILPLGAVGLAVVGLRLYAALQWNIGVPSRSPSPVPLRGVLFFITTVVPPLVAAMLIVAGERNSAQGRLRAAGVAILLLHTAVGVFIGWRGEALRNFLVWMAARKHDQLVKRSPGELIRLVAAGLGVFLAVGMALGVRAAQEGKAGGPSEVARFLFDRAGGIDYLTPIVGHVAIYGTDRALLQQSIWDRFLRREVYGISEHAQVAFAATAFGWWYATFGSSGVATLSLVAGIACAAWDGRRQSARRPYVRSRLLFVGAILVWTNFFLEGTGLTSLKTLIAVFGITGALVTYERLTRQAIRGAVPSAG